MNKTLVAALSGIAFGAVLGGIAASNGGSSHQLQVTVADCPPVSAPVCPAVLPPAPPLPAGCTHHQDSDSAEATEADEPAPLPMDADSQLSRAQTEYVNGNFHRAIEIVLPLTSKSPERSFRILGAAACNTHDEALADRSYSHLQSAGRQYLIYVCQRQGMSRVGAHFKNLR